MAGALIALGAVGIIALAGTLGGLTGGITALGAAVGPAAKGIQYLGDKITALMAPFEKTFARIGNAISFTPYIDPTTVDKSKIEPGMVIPWWMPIPAVGSVRREKAPSWVPNFGAEFGMGSAQGAAPPAASIMKPAAPSGSIMYSNGPRGTNGDPINVLVQNQLSGADIARGVSSNQASKANRPPSGYTGTDTRMDSMSAFYGMVNSPY